MLYMLILLLSMLSPKAQAACCDCPPNLGCAVNGGFYLKTLAESRDFPIFS